MTVLIKTAPATPAKPTANQGNVQQVQKVDICGERLHVRQRTLEICQQVLEQEPRLKKKTKNVAPPLWMVKVTWNSPEYHCNLKFVIDFNRVFANAFVCTEVISFNFFLSYLSNLQRVLYLLSVL